MKALSKLKAEEGIWMTDVPEPEVGHNDLLIKIRKTAICGTDVHIYNWDQWTQKTIPVPMVVGHEYVGEVVGIGQEVKGFQIGDRVSGEGHITCGHCRNCRGGRTHLCRNTIGVGVNRPGCFAEYLVIPAFNAFKIPDNISDDLPPSSTRSATRCTRRSPSTWSVKTCWSPVRAQSALWRQRSEARGRAQRCDHRRERIPSVAGAQNGRHPRGRCFEREPDRRDGRAGHDRRL